MSIQGNDFSLGTSINTENSLLQQKPPPSPAHSIHDNLSMPPTPGNWGASGEALSAAPSPMPMPESPAAPSPVPSMGLPEPDLPLEPIQPQIQPQLEPSSNDSSNYEPEPKRMRTASAEADFQDVEAGKGTAACIKLTQVNRTSQSMFLQFYLFSVFLWKTTSFLSTKWHMETIANLPLKSSTPL